MGSASLRRDVRQFSETDYRFETQVGVRPDLQFGCNPLICIGCLELIFTIKCLSLQVKNVTLNQRVPGSSPGAPTKPIKHLAASVKDKTATVYAAA
jgi:hypothetical protein